MTQKQFTSRNHYISESYLKQWVGSEGKIAFYRVLVPHEKMRTWDWAPPSSLCYQLHLYTRIENGRESDEFENYLSVNFEQPGLYAVGLALSDSRMSSDDWQKLTRFVAAQDARTPVKMTHFVRFFQDKGPAELDSVLEEFKKSRLAGQPVPLNTTPVAHSELLPIRVTVAPSENTPEIAQIQAHMLTGRSAALFGIKQLLSGSALKALINHKWTVLRAPQGVKWLTSDNPLVKLICQPDGTYQNTEAWGIPGTIMFIPLNPTHLLYTVIGKRPPLRGGVIDRPYAEELQALIIRHAHRYVLGIGPDERVETLRPRTVNLELYRKEREHWQDFHREQTDAEREFFVRNHDKANIDKEVP